MSAEAAAALIRARLNGAAPRIALLLGSGADGIAAGIAPSAAIPYGDLPGFRPSGVEGHAGKVILGAWQGAPVICCAGRVHLYEGGAAPLIRTMIRTLRLLGIDILVQTNAAGSLRPDWPAGSLVALADHINMMGSSPLMGHDEPQWGPRFPAMRAAYDPILRASLIHAAERAGVGLASGIYLATIGPNFETPAEIRAFRTIGADLVGMSTVPETIVARQCGMRVAAVSIVTNLAEGLAETPPSHDETLRVAAAAAERLGRVLDAWFAAGIA